MLHRDLSDVGLTLSRELPHKESSRQTTFSKCTPIVIKSNWHRNRSSAIASARLTDLQHSEGETGAGQGIVLVD